jgi:hypothetical protein
VPAYFRHDFSPAANSCALNNNLKEPSITGGQLEERTTNQLKQGVRIMTSRIVGAVCAMTGGLLLSCGVHAAQIGVFAKVSVGQIYAIEVEINDFTNASAVDLVHPTAGTFPLIFDSGERNWDAVSEDLTLSEVDAFFDETFDFEITHGGGLSIYTAARFGPPGADNFPEPASSLIVSPSTNPSRPTASWSGGDETADSMIITYLEAR